MTVATAQYWIVGAYQMREYSHLVSQYVGLKQKTSMNHLVALLVLVRARQGSDLVSQVPEIEAHLVRVDEAQP